MTRIEACMKLAQKEFREADRDFGKRAHGCKMRAKAFVFAASGYQLGAGLEKQIASMMRGSFKENDKVSVHLRSAVI